MKNHIDAIMSSSSIDNLIKDLDNYQKRVEDRCYELIDKLTKYGIDTAQLNVGGWGKYITFTRNITGDNGEFDAIMVASSGTIHVSWDTGETDISPLLMCEFGSGWMAENPFPNVSHLGGQATLNTYGHACDPKGWYWHDDEGWHHSYGVEPKQPLYKAWSEMNEIVKRLVREVFSY